MLLDTAEGSANLKDEAPYGLFVTQYANTFNSNIGLQLSSMARQIGQIEVCGL